MNITANSPFGQAPTETRLPSQQLKQDDFLKVLIAQMTTQDPLNPVKDAEFLGQMAQFSSLEQARGMQTEMTKLRSEQERIQAASLLGHRVEVKGADGQPLSGVVTGVELENGGAKLIINEQRHNLSEVLRVWQRN